VRASLAAPLPHDLSDRVACACAVFEDLVVRTVGTSHATAHDGAAGADAPDVARAKTQEACPKCAHPELMFYTLQLRSADEGQTVFYECEKCGHKFSQNN
jgi:DNA-directed RNA polymerase I subunit RPA12